MKRLALMLPFMFLLTLLTQRASEAQACFTNNYSDYLNTTVTLAPDGVRYRGTVIHQVTGNTMVCQTQLQYMYSAQHWEVMTNTLGGQTLQSTMPRHCPSCQINDTLSSYADRYPSPSWDGSPDDPILGSNDAAISMYCTVVGHFYDIFDSNFDFEIAGTLSIKTSAPTGGPTVWITPVSAFCTADTSPPDYNPHTAVTTYFPTLSYFVGISPCIRSPAISRNWICSGGPAANVSRNGPGQCTHNP